MITRALTLAHAHAEVAEGVIPGAGLTLAMSRGADTPPPARVLDISTLSELRGITKEDAHLRIGALVTMQQLRESEIVRQVLPALSQMAGEIGSAPLRRLATIGGNVAWGAGDLVPVLLAYRAKLLCAGAKVSIEAPQRRGLIEAVCIPLAPFALTFAEKAGLRESFSPSLITVAATARINDGKLHDVALAVGGGAEPPRRLPSSETALAADTPDALGGRLREVIEHEILGVETDERARLRARIAANLLADGLRENRP